MVIVFNKANRPIGIGGQSVLPDKEIQVKDKDAYCDVFDEYGNKTGEKQIIPGLRALEVRGFVSLRIVEEKVEKPVEKKAEEENVEEKPKRTKRVTKKKNEEVKPEEVKPEE